MPRIISTPHEIADAASTRQRSHAEEGQGLVEYALMLAFLAVLVIIALNHLQPAINGAINKTAGSLTIVTIDIAGTPQSSCTESASSITIPVGGTVKWTYSGTCGGSITITDSNNQSVFPGDIGPNSTSLSYVFSTPGTCTFQVRHYTSLIGTVTVQ
jgi:Flp pilus assembly pilin Flp